MTMRSLARYRPAGTRNYIAVGDTVRCTGAGRAFLARVTAIKTRYDDVDPDAVTDPGKLEVDLCVTKRVNGNDHPQRGMTRVVFANHLSRVAQTRHQETR